MQSWREFWDSDHAIYVNETHKAAHKACVARDLAVFLSNGAYNVLDFGCGEESLITQAKLLYLCDGAPSVLAKLKATHGDFALSPEELNKIPAGSLNRIFMVSVLQYLSLSEFETRLREFQTLLAPQGQMIIGDIINPQTGIIQDTLSLLSMAWREGFFFAAIMGLVKTALSNYRQLRESLGFTRMSESEINHLLEKHGFTVEHLSHNIGPHQHRYTIRAVK